MMVYNIICFFFEAVFLILAIQDYGTLLRIIRTQSRQNVTCSYLCVFTQFLQAFKDYSESDQTEAISSKIVRVLETKVPCVPRFHETLLNLGCGSVIKVVHELPLDFLHQHLRVCAHPMHAILSPSALRAFRQDCSHNYFFLRQSYVIRTRQCMGGGDIC